MLAKNPRGCLSLIPQNEWSQLLKCFTPLSGADKKNCRFIIANAVESVADKYGRIIIPTELRYYAKLDEDCIAVIIGTFNKVEIWNSSLYAVMTKS